MIDGLISIFQDETDFEVIGTASNGIETLKKLENTDCDVLLLDLIMPRMDGIETTKHVVKRYPNIKFLVLIPNAVVIRHLIPTSTNEQKLITPNIIYPTVGTEFFIYPEFI